MWNQNIALNEYQQLMLRLSHRSPYNAVHSVVIDTNYVSVTSLQSAVNTTINQLGLGEPCFSTDYQSVTYTPMKDPIAIISCDLALDKHIENEMNAPFSPESFPLRFFIVFDAPHTYFCITYNHWIADGYAIRRLMESIFNQLQGEPPYALSLNAPRVEDCFAPIYKKRIHFYRYLGVLQSFFQFSHAYRTKAANDECTETGCSTYFFPATILEGLTALCKREKITFNDLFMTILAQTLGRVTQEERNKIASKPLKPKRDRIVIGVIANIREPSQISLKDAFGLFLGFFYVSFKNPEQQSFQVLCQSVGNQTKRIKQHYRAIKNYLLFKVQTRLWDTRKSMRSQYRLFSKNTPIAVGISNMNLNKQEGPLQDLIQQYIRFSPTAMVCPIVFNLTTFNGYLSLGINYRKTCYSEAAIKSLQNDFIVEIKKLAESYSLS